MSNSNKVFNGNMCFVCQITIKETELKKCGSCKKISYCSEAHQKIHWKDHRSLCEVIKKVDSMLKPDNFENDFEWYKYRSKMLLFCELNIGRKLLPYETSMILFPNNCQVCHKTSDLKPCLYCLCICYCSEYHKIADLACHNSICHLFALCLQLDLHLEKNYFYPKYNFRNGYLGLEDSIDEFLEKNVEIYKDTGISSTQERALVSELLTCPLSLIFSLDLIEFNYPENFVVHVVGSSFLETVSLKSWEALLHVKVQIKNLIVHFIGPDAKENKGEDFCLSCRNRIRFVFSTDYYDEYLKNSGNCTPDVICSFNCGFHEFESSDLNTWEKSLPLLVKNKNVPLIFTSFTESEAEKDSRILSQFCDNLNLKYFKNKFSSLRPYRDFENLGIYFNNGYIAIALNKDCQILHIS